MMSVPDRSIDPRILESAKQEFLKNGFENTMLSKICIGAGVTTGALYKRYSGKEDLFNALVKETVDDLIAVVERKDLQKVSSLSDKELVEAWQMDEKYMLWWFDILEKHRDGFRLLLCCSDGTEYSNFQHDWVEKMTELTKNYLFEAQKRGLTDKIVDEKELHILLSAFWTTIYEPFIHNFSWEQIKAHSSTVCRLFNWYEAIGFKKSAIISN